MLITTTDGKQIDPQVHDTAQAKLHNDLARAQQAHEAHWDKMHRMAGDRKTTVGRQYLWKMTGAVVREQLEVQASVHGDKFHPAHGLKPSEALQRQAELLSRVAEILTEIRAMDAVWQQHRWPRYILCLSSNGHIHNYTGCHTLRPTSLLEWHPEFSGLTEAEAVNGKPELSDGTEAVPGLGPILCTHCFPTAPVEFKRDPAEVRRERTAAEKQAKADARQAVADAKAARAAEREARAATRKPGPRDRRIAALQGIFKKYPQPEDVDRQGRDSVAAEILDTLLPLGKSERWQSAVTAWANALRDTDNATFYAWIQCSMFVGNEA